MSGTEVAIVCATIAPDSPAGEQAKQLANTLAKRGARVSLITSHGVSPQLEQGVELHQPDGLSGHAWIWLTKYRRWAMKQVQALGHDRIVSFAPFMPARVVVPLTGLARDAPSAAHIPAKLLRSIYEQRMLRDVLVQSIVACSDRIETQLRSLSTEHRFEVHRYDPPVPRITTQGVWGVTLREKLARAWGINTNSFWVMHPFQHAKTDGFEQTALTFKALIESDVDAFLLLAGPSRYTHLAWLGEIGLRDRCRFIGPCEDQARLASACDLAILPTAYDPGGWKARPAFSAGCPLITTAASDAAEQARERGGAVLDTPGDPQRMLQAIRRYADQGPRDFALPPTPPTGEPESPLADLIQGLLDASTPA